MVYALNMSSNTLTAVVVCVAVGVLAVIGLIITAVVIAKYKKAKKYDAVTVDNTAPVQPKAISAPDRPQLPAPEEVKAEQESTATDDPVTEAVSEAEEPEEKVQEVAEPEKAEEPEAVEAVEEPATEEPAEQPTEQPAEEPAEEVAEAPAEEPEVEEVVEEKQPAAEEPEAVEAVEEPVTEEPTEQPAEEPAEEVAEAPAEESEVEEVVEEVVKQPEEVEADGEGTYGEEENQTEIYRETTRVVPEGKILVRVRYNRSYTARLIQSQDILKGYYGEVKNELLRYGVSDRISWKYETFRKGRKLLARIAVRGKKLGVYLALNPADFENTKYKVEDVSAVKRNAAVPTLYRIKNDRRCRYVKDLIAKLMAENGLEAGEEKNENYSAQYPYEELEPLIDRKLVKLLPWKEFASGSEVGLIAVSKDDLPTEILMGEVSVAEAENMFVGGDIDVLVESSAKYSDKTKKDIVNIDTLGRYFNPGETVTVEEIRKRVPNFNKRATYVKVLARGKLDKALTVEADDFSPEAIKMIVLTGGKAVRKKANN